MLKYLIKIYIPLNPLWLVTLLVIIGFNLYAYFYYAPLFMVIFIGIIGVAFLVASWIDIRKKMKLRK